MIEEVPEITEYSLELGRPVPTRYTYGREGARMYEMMNILGRPRLCVWEERDWGGWWQPVVKPRVPDVVDRFIKYHAKGGMALHIILDDENCGDRDAEFCIKWARFELEDEAGEELAVVLRAMSKTQRLRISHIVWDERYRFTRDEQYGPQYRPKIGSFP